MSITLSLTEDKMKAGTKRMLAELKLAGVNLDGLGYNKALHIFSKALLDKPYEEVKGANFDDNKDPVVNTHSVYLLRCGSDTILAVDGAYEGATNTGTDLEVPDHALSSQAQFAASKLGVSVRVVTLPNLLDAPDTDDEWVELAREMGYFEPHRSIFCHFGADQIYVNGMLSAFTIDGDWQDTLEAAFEAGEDLDTEIVWHAECEEGWDKYEYFFSFGALKRATYKGHGEWLVPYNEGTDSETQIPVRFRDLVVAGKPHA